MASRQEGGMSLMRSLNIRYGLVGLKNWSVDTRSFFIRDGPCESDSQRVDNSARFYNRSSVKRPLVDYLFFSADYFAKKFILLPKLDLSNKID